jgi:hypothetical protein
MYLHTACGSSISGASELCDKHGGAESEEGDRCEPEPMLSFTEVHAAYNTVKPFFYVYSIGKHDEQNILNLE